MQKLSFLMGAGVGYVLGTRSGRSRYDQIVAGARNVMDQPQVQSATAAATEQAKVTAGKVGAVVKSATASAQEQVSSRLNRNKPAKAGPGVHEPYPTPTPGATEAGATRAGVPDQQTQ